MEVKIAEIGVFHGRCYDKDGNLKWEDWAFNGGTIEGFNHMLNTEFHGSAAAATWYIGLITGTGTLAEADTLASHAGWTEGVDFTSGNRQEWTEGAASNKVMTNSSTVDFAITGTMTTKGAFLATVTSGTSGTLFCTAAWTGGDQVVNNADTLKITYTLTLANV